MSERLSAPPRLLDTAGPAGDCLRRARLEQPSLPPLPRFAELRERRQRRVQRRASALVVGVTAIGLLMLHGLRRDERAPGIRAEPTAPAPAAALPSPSNTLPASEQSRTPALKPAATTSRSSRPHAIAAAAPLAARGPAPAGTTSSAKTCAELARQGDTQHALDCYAELAGGDGLSAELALFEAARIEGKVLHRPARAVQILERHQQRFPNGSLRGEVMLAQIGWLLAAGDDARARALVDEALASGLLRERTAELQRLREKLAQPRVGE